MKSFVLSLAFIIRFTANTIHPGIFPGGTVFPESDSQHINTITSRDQFNPITFREKIGMNYKKLKAYEISAFSAAYPGFYF